MINRKTRRRSQVIDFLIVVLCLSVCGFSLFLFWKDLNSTTTRTDKDTIAIIEFKQRIAQRKFSDRVVWERLQNKSPLYSGDTLRTAAQSEATVTFNNKAAIEVHENTMLQIFYTEDGGVKINVGGGDIEIDTSTVEVKEGGKSGPAIVIQTAAGSVLNVSAGSKLVAATNNETGISSFSIQEGNASITSEDGKTVTLEHGETANVEHSGEVSKGKFTVTSVSKNLRILNFEEEEEEAVPVELEWQATDELKEKPVKIETSRTKNFEQVENTYIVENENNFTLPASDGTIYWRVSVVEDEAVLSEPVEGKIRVDNVEPLKIVSPANGFSYNYRKDLPKVNFRWEDSPLAAKYKLEVSSFADFSYVLYTQELNQNSASLALFQAGTYFWRVTPFYSINNTGYAAPSEAASFSVVKNEELTPPVLTVPANDSTLTYQAKEFNVTFLWKSDVKDADYKLVISDDENFNHTVYETDIKEKRLYGNFSQILSVGTYFWKVIRTSDEDESPAETAAQKFTVIKYVPGETRLIYPPEEYSVEELKVSSASFMWKLADEYKNSGVDSTIQIASDSEFKNVVVQETVKTQPYTVKKLQTGKYFWRVGVVNSFEDKIEYTKPRTFTVLGEMESSVITAPDDGSEIVAMQNSPVLLKWTGVEGADYYSVVVKDISSGKVVYENSVTGTETLDFVVPSYSGQKKNNYRLTVQPVAEQTDISPLRKGKEAAVEFAVRSAVPVKLVSPSAGVKIDGLAALRKPVVLEWESSIDKAEKTTLILRKLQSNGTMKEIRRIDTTSNSLSFDRLSAGTYEWTVTASTEDGLPINAEENRRFTITAVPALTAPSSIEPKNNFVIGPDYLRKNRVINFSWKPVSGATDYTFTLNLRRKDGTIKKIYSEKNIRTTSLKFKKLDLLDVGDFEWNVTPYCHAKDGFEEQTGKTVSSKFSIQFELPDVVETHDPGRVYGE